MLNLYRNGALKSRYMTVSTMPSLCDLEGPMECFSPKFEPQLGSDDGGGCNRSTRTRLTTKDSTSTTVKTTHDMSEKPIARPRRCGHEVDGSDDSSLLLSPIPSVDIRRSGSYFSEDGSGLMMSCKKDRLEKLRICEPEC